MVSSASMASCAAQLQERRVALVSTTARDPRAAAAPHAGVVTVSESCQFYGYADAVSRCRTPRSCQDCLATPGCGITTDGYCMNATSDADWFSRNLDYRTANFSADSLVSNTSFFVFFAGTASYCAASDPVCTKCRSQFQQLSKTSYIPFDITTQFCRGDNGCVCIAMCEVPLVRAWRVYDHECNQPQPLRLFLDKPVRQSFTSPHRDPRASLVNVLERKRPDESCGFHFDQDLRGCRRPRTCQECLRKENCVISNFRCVSMEDYNPSADFRHAALGNLRNSSPQYLQFPSANTTYCPSTDAVCRVCREKFAEHQQRGFDFSTLSYNSEFCVGTDGCVCIEVCESETWAVGVFDGECSRTGYKAGPVNAFMPIFLAAIVWILLLAAYKYARRQLVPPTRRQVEQAGARILRHMLDEVPALARLDLFGWRAYQERLNYQEQRLLEGHDVSLTVAHPVDFDRMDPSAPDFDEDESSAPTAHDPKALASAPVFRSSFLDSEEHTTEGSSSSHGDEFSTPSAPDFDEEDINFEWIGTPRHDERRGQITRRSRREA